MPGTKVYRQRILITFVKGKTLASAVGMTGDEETQFERFIVDALDTLNRSQTGRRLLNEIGQSGHSCSIFAGDVNDDNCAKPAPDNVANGIARMAVNFRPFQKNLPKSAKEQKHPKTMSGAPLPPSEAAPLIQAYKDMVADRKAIGVVHGVPVDTIAAGAELLRVLRRAHQRGGHALYSRALRSANLTNADLKAVIHGTRKLTDDEYFKLCFYLYDFLTPGPGCPTQVRIQLPNKFKKDFKSEYKAVRWGWLHEDKSAWKKVAAVIIGHELVHAWRMMTGRRIVDDGYEEEIMTVGCGPFANFPMTENAIRRDLRLATRPGYQPLSRYYSDLAATMISDPNAVVDVI